MNVHTRWREPRQDGPCVAWARQLFTAAAPFATGSGYVNFMPADEADRIEKVYGANYRQVSLGSREPFPAQSEHPAQPLTPVKGEASMNRSR